MSLKNISMESNDVKKKHPLIGHALYEVCHWMPSGEVSVEGGWYIIDVVGEDENGNLIVKDDEYHTTIIGVYSFLTPEEAYESATNEEKKCIEKWWLK